MKRYIIVLGDGMSDIGNPTPLSIAHKPTIDNLAKYSELGMVQTVAEGFSPGSDVANLAVLGYNVEECYTGRAPIEATSQGIDIGNNLAVRCNLVCLAGEGDFFSQIMLDYSAGEVDNQTASILIDYLNQQLQLNSTAHLHSGVSYRNLLVYNGKAGTRLVPPHDFSGKPVADHLPTGVEAGFYTELMQRAHQCLSNHPINVERVKQGKPPINGIWLWGEGTKPSLTPFPTSGAMISGVDLLKGIGILSGMTVYSDPSFTANLNTNYRLKTQMALEALKDHQLVFVHVEASDECGHQGDFNGKVKAIENLDSLVVKPIVDTLTSQGCNFSLLFMPDHATPHALKTHTSNPVPYLIYNSTNSLIDTNAVYTEDYIKNKPLISLGYTLLKHFLA